METCKDTIHEAASSCPDQRLCFGGHCGSGWLFTKPLCFSLLAVHGISSFLSPSLSPPCCGAIQIGWTCSFFRFTLCILTNLLPDNQSASPQILEPLISMVTKGMEMLGICLRELAGTSCFPGMACPFAVNGAAWGEVLPPAG